MAKKEIVEALYNGELFKWEIVCPETRIVRVPGGWVMETYSTDTGETTGMVFIPFSNEFMPSTKHW